MPKLYWFPFVPKDWISDPALSQVSCGARGVASDLMCVAFQMPNRGIFQTNGIPWTMEQIAKSVRGESPRSRLRLVEELCKAGVLKVNDQGAWYWPRMTRDEANRQMDALRQRRKRDGKRGKESDDSLPV